MATLALSPHAATTQYTPQVLKPPTIQLSCPTARPSVLVSPRTHHTRTANARRRPVASNQHPARHGDRALVPGGGGASDAGSTCRRRPLVNGDGREMRPCVPCGADRDRSTPTALDDAPYTARPGQGASIKTRSREISFIIRRRFAVRIYK